MSWSRFPGRWTAIGIAALAGIGCSDSPDGRVSTVVLIAIDTLRADRLACYGSSAASTPVLDSLAVAGTRFEDVTTTAPVTLPAMTSVLTGLYPFRHGVRDNGFFALEEGVPTLAERFRAAGWRTEAAVASAVLARDRGLARGFDSWDDAFGPPYPVYSRMLEPEREQLAHDRRRADTVTDRGIAILRSKSAEPLFLFLHYFDPHMHLDPPPEWSARHPGRPYDAEVSFTDSEIGRLLGALPEPDRTLVVVVADHGESMGEHGEPQHGFLLFDSTLRVPWIAAGPGVPRGRVRHDRVSLVDVAPTLASELGLDGIGEGRALRWDEEDPDPPAHYAETLHPLVSYGWSALRAVRRGAWKLVAGPRDELYDLASDPHELAPVGDEAAAEELRKVLAGFVAEDGNPERIRAQARAGTDAQPAELLESLGYTGMQSDDPARPHPADALPEWVALQESARLRRISVTELMAGNYRSAAVHADSGLARAPSADLWFLRGEAARLAGRNEEAAECFRRALELDPEHPTTRESVRLLREATKP